MADAPGIFDASADPIRDRVAVVVGGGTGIGAAVARSLALAGGRVVIGGRRMGPLREVAGSVDGSVDGSVHAGHAIDCHELDVASADSVSTFFKHVEAFGSVDILVNSAGINIARRTMAEMDPEDWTRVLNINASGAYRVMHAVLPSMRRRGTGTIVQVSSIAGKRALELGGVAYCASKFAMTALGTAASNEAREDGVRVTNVYPGEVETPLLDQRPVPVSEERRRTMLQPQDVADVILTICRLPPRAHVPEVVVKPTVQHWM